MTALRQLFALLALAALLAGAGCGGDSLPTAIETDDPVYRQGKQLQRLERYPEALVAFLKVIEKRGERFSPESHLEAGQIYLQHIKDPVEAIHHLRKYVELSPKSREAPLVRGLIEEARRQFYRTAPGRPLEDQSQWLNLRTQLENLQRENDQLKIELATRGGGSVPAPIQRSTRVTLDNPPPRPAPVPAPAAVDDSPIALAPVLPPAAQGSSFLPAAPSAPAKAGRKHVVAIGDTLYNVARKYGVKMEDLAAANRDVVPPGSSNLKLGVELKIP
jgi:tetratricopeptide (TPR) repeat protein